MSITRTVTAACSLTPEGAELEGNCAWCAGPLPRTKAGNIPKGRVFCKKACSDLFSLNHNWSWARRAAVRRDKGQCIQCGVSERKPPYAKLEVNHIHSLADQGMRGYAFGCHHHLDNLETLCRPHHVEVTTEQRRARKERSESAST